MKRFLLLPVCALFAVGLSSCQKEEKSALDLAKELTTELQTVTDYQTAQAAAPRVAVLYQRWFDAHVRAFAVNGTPVLETAEKPAAYADAVITLAKEIGRIRASKPVESYDGEIDRDRLLLTVALNAGNKHDRADLDTVKEEGWEHLRNDADTSHAEPPSFKPYYGSDALEAALSYEASTEKFGFFEGGDDVEEVPARGAAAPSTTATDSDEDSDDSADDSEDSADDADEDTDDNSSDDDDDDDLDI